MDFCWHEELQWCFVDVMIDIQGLRYGCEDEGGESWDGKNKILCFRLGTDTPNF